MLGDGPPRRVEVAENVLVISQRARGSLPPRAKRAGRSVVKQAARWVARWAGLSPRQRSAAQRSAAQHRIEADADAAVGLATGYWLATSQMWIMAPNTVEAMTTMTARIPNGCERRAPRASPTQERQCPSRAVLRS